MGEYLRFTGEIVQITEDSDGTFMRVDVTKTSYGYTDTIAVLYLGSVDVYEDDVVWLWGECRGAFSYTSIMGAEITIPGILAEYVEKAK
jgi:hypothetical protein